MAMKHRKLYPTLTNQTVDCPDFCDPSCPYNCYPIQEFYFPPPPPPSPPRPSDQNHHISTFVIIIVSILASFFLLVSYYVVIRKSCAGRCNSNEPASSQSDSSDEEFIDGNQVNHPIWFITTVGLQQSVVNSITICKYKKGEGLIEGTECSVCLSEFQEDETLRLLPKCSHAFHICCIDTWLRSHTNCPLCRAPIVSGPMSSDIVRPPLALMDQSVDNLGTNEDSRIENSETDCEFSENQVGNGGVCQNRAGTEDEGDIQETNVEGMSKEGVNCNGNGVFQVLNESISDHQVVDDEIQSVRRSISMNSASAASICLGEANCCQLECEGILVDQIEEVEKSHLDIVRKQDGGCSSVFRLMGNSSIAQCLHKSPASLKRSFSCGGRHNQSLNSILPL